MILGTTTAAIGAEGHVDNPYAGATQYVNDKWSAAVTAEARAVATTNPTLAAQMLAIKDQPTAVWMDRIGAINGNVDGPGLKYHLDAALKQKKGSAPIVLNVVIYNLPGRDCYALASNGELPATAAGLTRYKNEYIDPIAELLAKPEYAGIRVSATIEPDSLPNLSTNMSEPACQTSAPFYKEGVKYALDKLHAITNVYTYVDAAHSGWLGWDNNASHSVQTFVDVAKSTKAGFASIDGFVTNTANSTPLVEPYLPDSTRSLGGTPIRSSSFYEWNFDFDEIDWTADLYTRLVANGFPSSVGMLIDTSRNGWGGPNRPTATSTSSSLETYINESKVDKRTHRGAWCNPAGAGIGERPQATPSGYSSSHLDAFVWVKPPGESDGSSSFIPNDEGKGFDRMCDPTFNSPKLSGKLTGALAGAPVSGKWFSAQFQQLVTNAYPAIPATGVIDPNPEPTTDPTTEPTSEPTTEPTSNPTTPTDGEAHVDNPYAGATQYVNDKWSAAVAAEASAVAAANPALASQMRSIKDQPTAVWMDRIGAINGNVDGPGLKYHLDAALAQKKGNTPIVLNVVIYNLPGRDCYALASNGELPATAAGLTRYKTEYIDPIAALLAKPEYAGIRISATIEPDSLPNLSTNMSEPACQTSAPFYKEGVKYALDKLHAITNVYTYVDAAHSGWLGWDNNAAHSVQTFIDVAKSTKAGFASIDGFVTNTANSTPLVEPFLTDSTKNFNGAPVRSSSFYEWNFDFDEIDWTADLYTRLVAGGFPSSIGMLIDTSRNGWGGTARPTAVSTSSDLNTYVNESKVDKRTHRGAWCNPAGAGIGERPQATPAGYASSHLDAFVWVKPPGESDGSSTFIPNDEGKGFDRMCDPTFNSPKLDGKLTGALAGAPVSGKWFSAQFQQLVTNAYPAIPATTPEPTVDTVAPSVPTNVVAGAKTTSSIALSWTASTDNVGVTGYDIYSGGVKVATSTTTSFTVTGLTADTSYTFTVRAKDAAGNVSAASVPLTAKTAADVVIPLPDTIAPTVPTNLVAGTTTTSTIPLSWTASTDNVGVTGYDIYEGGVRIGSSVGTSYTVTGLPSNTSYTFTVRAKDAAGNVSADSAPVTAATKSTVVVDTVAPSIPANLVAAATSTSAIALTWTASTDNVGVTGYDIYQGASKIASSTGTSYTATGLAADTSYTFTVRAKDAAGNISAASAPATAKTQANPVNPASSCQVVYSTNDWNTGFTASLKIKNTGTTAINGWSLGFSFPAGQVITNGWSAIYAANGATQTVTNQSWNGTIAAGQTVEIGFNGSHNGTNTRPTSFTLNGATCS